MLKQPLPSRSRGVVASTFVMLSVAASMMAAWAAQPASTPPHDEGFHYRISATLDVDGERQSFSLRDGPGRPVGITASTNAGREWRLELVVTPAPDDQVKIEGDLRVDGERVSSPVLIAMLDKGMSNREIATQLEISEHTVKVHLWRLFRRLGVKSRTQALHHARNHGLLMSSNT